MKKCNICKRELDREMFYSDKSTKDGLHFYCKECRREGSKEHYQNNKEKIDERNRTYAQNNREKIKEYFKIYRQNNKEKLSKKGKEYHLSSSYGLTVEKYNEMVTNQNTMCLLCLKKTQLVVDHCHRTGNVRGLLCGNCNTALGLFEDNVNNLGRAIEYLTIK